MVFYVHKNKVYDFCLRTAIYAFLIEHKKYKYVGHLTFNAFAAIYEKRKVIVQLFRKDIHQIYILKEKTNIKEVHIFWYDGENPRTITEEEKNYSFNNYFEMRIKYKNEDLLLRSIRDIEDEILIKKLFGSYLKMKSNVNKLYYKYKGRWGIGFKRW